MSILSTIYLLMSLLGPASPLAETVSPSQGEIQVTVSGLRNTDGQLGILLFNAKDGFPAEREKAYKEILLPVSEPIVRHTFTGLSQGDYAISVMHDENKNNQLDTGLWGIPTEGHGVSNNVRNRFGPPRYKQAVFQLDQNTHSLDIKVRY